MSTEVDVVRVFTNQSGDFGNELGIVVGEADAALATRLGFSETVFISSVEPGCATMRIFTPARELPFAGHPSVGAAWWLAQRGTPIDVLVEKAGDVAVRYDGELTWITGEASWAPEFEFHPLGSVAEVDALDPHAPDFGSGAHYAWTPIEGGIRSRMFGAAMGIVEDEATGAAAVRITAQLERDLTIAQGAGSVLHTRYLGAQVEVGGRTVFDRTLRA
jgi:predicted PhzF superfamily epimerase YddE/YHI9